MGSRWFVFECFIGIYRVIPSTAVNRQQAVSILCKQAFCFCYPNVRFAKKHPGLYALFRRHFLLKGTTSSPDERHKGATRRSPDPRNQQIDDSSCDHVDQNHLLEIPNLSSIMSKEDTPNFWSPFRKKGLETTKNTVENTQGFKKSGG